MTEPAPVSPISTEIKATQFEPQQVIEFGRETPTDQTLKDLHEIRQKDQKSEGAKKGFERLKMGNKEISLSQADIEKIDNLVGVEETVRKEIKGEMRDVDIFLEVAIRSQRENVGEQVILNEIKKSGKWKDVPTLSEINRNALKAMRESPVIRAYLTGSSDNDINEAIITSILSTPESLAEFRHIYAQLKKAEVDRIAALPQLKEVEGKKQKEDKRDELWEKSNRHIEALKTITGLEESKIVDLFNQDLEQAQIIEQVFQQALEGQNVQGVDISGIKKAIQSEVTIKSLGDEIRLIDDSIDGINERLSTAESTSATTKTGKTERTNQIKAIKAEKERAEAKRASKQKTVDRLNKEFSDLTDEFKAKISSYKDVYKKIFGKEAAPGEEEINARALVPVHIQKLIEDLPKLRKEIKDIEDLETADKEYQKQLGQRKFEEEDIIRQLKFVLNDSMVDFLVKRIDTMNGLDIKRQTNEKDERFKKYDKDMNKRYIEFDGKQEKHYRTKIRSDMDAILKYGKEDGELIIVARILDIKDAAGTTSISDDMTKWSEDQITEVKKIHDQRAGELRKNLFGSYYKSRLLGERSWLKIGMPFSKDILFEGTLGSLALTDAQFKNLAEQYSTEMEAAISSSKQAQEVIKGLKEKGINPNINMKWLLYILIALGLIVGIHAIISVVKPG